MSLYIEVRGAFGTTYALAGSPFWSRDDSEVMIDMRDEAATLHRASEALGHFIQQSRRCDVASAIAVSC
ncbi:hypothetical protein KGQ24_02275 [Patescibacteria group bacterium]|nr:hypothetical protein [Patescibacteria group bacterium]